MLANTILLSASNCSTIEISNFFNIHLLHIFILKYSKKRQQQETTQITGPKFCLSIQVLSFDENQRFILKFFEDQCKATWKWVVKLHFATLAQQCTPQSQLPKKIEKNDCKDSRRSCLIRTRK